MENSKIFVLQPLRQEISQQITIPQANLTCKLNPYMLPTIVVRTWTCPDLDRGPGPEVHKVRVWGAGPGPAAKICHLWTC